MVASASSWSCSPSTNGGYPIWLKNQLAAYQSGPLVKIGWVRSRRLSGLRGQLTIGADEAEVMVCSSAEPVGLVWLSVFSETLFESINGTTPQLHP